MKFLDKLEAIVYTVVPLVLIGCMLCSAVALLAAVFSGML